MTRGDRASSEALSQVVQSPTAPIPLERGEGAALAVHKHLRELIIGGALAPGTVINQLALAPLLGVSRTPLREAIRRLQEEGLVVAEPQMRARVASFDPELLESTYVQRMFLEGLAAQQSAAEASDEDIENLVATYDEWRAVASESGDNALARARANRRFHLRLATNVGPSMQASIEQLIDRSDHWLLSAVDGSHATRGFDSVDAEHLAIIAAFRDRDGPAATVAVTKHLRGGLFLLLERLAPDYVPTAAQTAVAMVAGRSRRPQP